MKWYNKEKTKMIDLSKVGQFDYNPTNKALVITVDGNIQVVPPQYAEELYNALISLEDLYNKQVTHKQLLTEIK
jgi:hypothetical protein